MLNSFLNVPDELRGYRQWVCWRQEYDYAQSRWKKPPYNPRTGKRAIPGMKNTWGTFEEAITALQEHGYDGIGFMLTRDDPFSFIDLDDVIDHKTGEVEAWALEIVERFGSYTEISPSGEGLHIAIRAQMPFKKAGSKPVELFSCGGYVTITGNIFESRPIQKRRSELDALYREIRPQWEMVFSHSIERNVRHDITDSELLDRARGGHKLGSAGCC